MIQVVSVADAGRPRAQPVLIVPWELENGADESPGRPPALWNGVRIAMYRSGAD